jgi:sugar lactone lactonase YvrE
MNVRRLGFFVAALPLAFYVYACSSDDTGGEETPDGGVVDGNTDFDTGTNPGIDSGNPDPDAGGDAGGDGAAPACVGNPLLGAAASTPDGGVAVEAGALRTLTGPVNQFNDGPQWIDQFGGGLVYTEVFTKRVVRIGPDGGVPVEIRALGNGAGTAGLTPIGNAQKNGVILTTVASTSNTNPAAIWQTLPDGGAGGPNLAVGASVNPNDLAVAPSGQLYFTDPLYQSGGAARAVYRMLGDGGVTTIQQGATDRPNGIALSADGTKLFVGIGPSSAETPATNRRILAYTLDGTGGSPIVTGNPTTVVNAATLGGTPDGLAVDVGGNIWAAVADSAGGNSGALEVFSPTGAKLGSIAVAGDRPVGIAFGGADGKTVYLTTENGVRVFQSRCAGVR